MVRSRREGSIWLCLGVGAGLAVHPGRVAGPALATWTTGPCDWRGRGAGLGCMRGPGPRVRVFLLRTSCRNSFLLCACLCCGVTWYPSPIGALDTSLFPRLAPGEGGHFLPSEGEGSRSQAGSGARRGSWPKHSKTLHTFLQFFYASGFFSKHKLTQRGPCLALALPKGFNAGRTRGVGGALGAPALLTTVSWV